MPLLSIYHKTEYRYLHPVAFGSSATKSWLDYFQAFRHCEPTGPRDPMTGSAKQSIVPRREAE
jgi:hypothetical protein